MAPKLIYAFIKIFMPIYSEIDLKGVVP